MISSPVPLVVVIGAIVTLGLTRSLFAASLLPIAAQAGAVVLSVWARRSFPTGTFRAAAAPGGPSVIRQGPYRFIRHPMYSAALLFIWAAVLSHLSVLNGAIGLTVTVVVVLRVIVEERLLRARYPEYSGYARSTKALIPFMV